MKIYEVLIEYASSSLDRPFSYVYKGEKNIFPFCRVLVNFNNRTVCGFVLDIKNCEITEEEYKKNTGFILKEIVDVIDEQPLLTENINLLAMQVADYYFAPLISVYFAMLPPSLKPSISSKNKPKIAYEQFVKPIVDVDFDNLTTRQAEVLYRIINEGVIKKKELPPHIVNVLLEKNKIVVYSLEKNRLNIDKVDKIDDLKLNNEQKNAFETILYGDESTYLLHGVTGSGKTEVYLQIAREIIKQGKQVLMLVPEISLTYAMVKRFKSRFDNIAILHSELTPGQRYDEYRKIRNQSVDIVIGARSAIFAPLENIGLIIIDEEHSETYKQSDQMPYYNAIEVAKMRQKQIGCKLILGSATPSLETKSRALKGIYKDVLLTKRVDDLSLPNVKVVSMSDWSNIDKKSTMISIPLREAISKRLENKEQTILLINRRGYSPYISCRKCGHVIKCPDCQIALTYHNDSGNLMCHHCGYETKMINTCPKCKSDKIMKSGFGSEKVEQHIKEIFPQAKTLRLDSDIMKKRGGANNVLTAFERQEADILIGTQIVAKGHDFPNVTLVGVVLADIGMAIPSFRAGERTFSLLTQAVGRSGRNKIGEAIIQTFSPNHYILKTACQQDYMKFYATEIYYRKLLQNPPYTFMTLLIVSGENEDDVIDAIYEVDKYLKMHLENNNNVTLVGPSDMFIKKYQKKYRRKLLIKYKDFSVIKPLLDDLKLFFIKKGSLNLQIDIDPYEDY